MGASDLEIAEREIVAGKEVEQLALRVVHFVVEMAMQPTAWHHVPAQGWGGWGVVG